MPLRPYQHRALYEELLPWFANHSEGHPIVSACVGAGKSIMIAELCRHAIQEYSGYKSRFLILVPSKELLEQNYQKLVAIGTGLKIGLISASAGRKDLAFDKDVILATVGSVIKNPGNLGRLDIIMVDECHLINRTETGQYRQLITECTKFNPGLRVIGWTGTPYRGNGIWLTEGKDRLFTDIAARVPMTELLATGFLSPLVSAVPAIQVKATDIAIDSKTGDYKINQLAAALDQTALTEKIVQEIIHHGQDRKKWMVFGVTIEHAEHLTDELKKQGIKAAIVTGKTPKAERERTIAAFRAGRYQALVNVAVLTTGFDVPDVDLIALVRNTKSPVLYTQIAGRGMRLHPGKTDCLWLDFTDTTQDLGPVDQIKGRGEPKKKQTDDKELPFKVCQGCGASNATGAAHCVACAHPFPVPEPKVYSQTSGASILSGNPFGYLEYPITRVSYDSHKKKDSDEDIFIMKATYWSHMKAVCTEWVCFEHTGYARRKAENWWKQRYAGKMDLPVPKDTLEALHQSEFLKTPTRIIVKKTGKYPELINAMFDTTQTEEAAA